MLERFGRTYGDGHVFGEMSQAEFEKFMSASAWERSEALGWSNACPVVPRILTSGEKGRSPEEMQYRYAQINFWYGYMVDRLASLGRADLAEELTTPQERQPDEPLGKHDKGWIPEELKRKMYGPGGPYAYNLSRLMANFINEGKGTAGNRASLAMKSFDKVVRSLEPETEGLDVLLATFSENLISYKRINRLKILSWTISSGKISEDNCRTNYGRIVKAIDNKTTELKTVYHKATDAVKTRLHIAQI